MQAVRFFLFLGLFLFSQLGAAADGIAGSYSGRYHCGDWRSLELQVREAGNGRISAVFTFPVAPNAGMGSYQLVGQFDPGSGRFHLEPQQWIRRPPGFNMVGMEGVRDSATRALRGKISNFNCDAFELVPQGMTLSQLPASPSGPPPIERRKFITNVTNEMPKDFEYWDSSMGDAPEKAREAEPIDDVMDWLKGQDFSCLGTVRVSWDGTGTQGTANDRVSIRERYVIECDGDCRGVRYMPYVQATVFHFGATQPVPVLEMKAVFFGGSSFRWNFTRPAGARKPPPDIYIHQWTPGKLLSGEPCKHPKTENR